MLGWTSHGALPEGVDMLQALKKCDVPAKQLIYDTPLHNHFVLDLNPVSAAASSSCGISSLISSAALSTMHAYAQDVSGLVTWKVQLNFSSSSSSAV